eukprot:SM000123S25852  [mRNA]  locus=s123:273403:273764:+ [translate_table: standard]
MAFILHAPLFETLSLEACVLVGTIRAVPERAVPLTFSLLLPNLVASECGDLMDFLADDLHIRRGQVYEVVHLEFVDGVWGLDTGDCEPDHIERIYNTSCPPMWTTSSLSLTWK